MALQNYLKRWWKRLKHNPTHREKWETRWGTSNSAPAFSITDNVPTDLQAAVTDGWFPIGVRVLDIGCGSGELALWLAGQGYQVLGVDFSSAAISRARTSMATDRASFEVLDICRAAPNVSPFPALFDRGCLHTIPEEDAPAYMTHISEAAATGAHFLLLYGFMPKHAHRWNALDAWREAKILFLTELFEPQFIVLSITDTVLERAGGSTPQPPLPGLAIRMERK